jgi:hypothetical protein
VTELVDRAKELALKAQLEDLRASVRYGELVAKMQLAAVAGAREIGGTWEQIGNALGVTHQAARQRWDRKLKKDLPQETAD